MAPLGTTAPLAAARAAEGERAASRAIDEAIGSLSAPAGLVLAFPTGIDPAQAARELSADRAATVIGVTGNGAIAVGGSVEQGCAAIAFDRSLGFGVGIAPDASRDLREAGRSAAGKALSSLDASDRSGPLLLLFLDTHSGDQSEAIAGAYEAARSTIPIAGGAAGGSEPAQIVGDRAFRDAVVAVAVDSPGPVGIGAAHGCRVQSVPSTVTRSEGRLLLELDGRPAATVYQEKLGLEGLSLPDEAFEKLAVTHPLAQPELHGAARIRHVLGRQGNEGLLCATHIPVNAAVEFTHEAPDDIIAASSEAVAEALAPLGERPPRAALLFDCAGRKRAVGAALQEEVFGLVDSFPPPPPPLAGLFTHGEVARVRGAKGDLNHAVVVVAFG